MASSVAAGAGAGGAASWTGPRGPPAPGWPAQARQAPPSPNNTDRYTWVPSTDSFLVRTRPRVACACRGRLCHQTSSKSSGVPCWQPAFSFHPPRRPKRAAASLCAIMRICAIRRRIRGPGRRLGFGGQQRTIMGHQNERSGTTRTRSAWKHCFAAVLVPFILQAAFLASERAFPSVPWYAYPHTPVISAL
jgi:hypothetical protein